MEEHYQPEEIETKAQHYWQTKKSFQIVEDVNKEKFYCLSMMPYPSGHLHMGHVRNYTIGDVISRYQHMLGKNVLQPMSWDAFGLPAENAAIKHEIPPAEWTRKNIEIMRGQMNRMGFAYDWSREFATCDPSYYRWEQWFFLRLLKKGLAYKKNAEVNWDPVDQTVLANEQVINGRGWRSGALVERREISQWFFKITAYSEELLKDLDQLDAWPEQVKTMQRNWIGRSEGAEIKFSIDGHHLPLSVYTTRPDTLYGVTFLALAPQHPLVEKCISSQPELKAFIESCRHTKLAEAELATLEKRGLPLNLTAKHPLTQEALPIWVANFVLMDYGSGALMAVPAHDARDHEFAQRYQLPIKQVIQSVEKGEGDVMQKALTEKGHLIHSGPFNGLHSNEAANAIIHHLEAIQQGQRQINYRLRDWSVSRQRYWGTPIPMINCTDCGSQPVPEKDLPVLLPEDVSFKGASSPLKSMESFLKTTCPNCHGPAERETDTFDTFMESSWYYARLACKQQNKAMLDGRVNYWLGVDQYIGGIEHAVLHLLYARFFHKLMRDEGLVNSDEPFVRLLTQGMVLNDGVKMSKSKGNVVDPQPLIDRFGADTVRLFTMFAAPPEQSLEWSDSGVEGAHRFLKRLWAFAYENRERILKQNRQPEVNLASDVDWENADPNQVETLRQIFNILEQAKFDYERQQFNTVVSSCMKMLNQLTKIEAVDAFSIDIQDIVVHKGVSLLLSLLAPITPHITHQLWQDLNYGGTVLQAPWPKTALNFKVETIELVVQVNGKLRSRIQVPNGADKSTVETNVLNDAKVKQILETHTLKRLIIVPNKLVNLVIEKK